MVLDGHVEMVMVPTARASNAIKNRTCKTRSLRERKGFSCQNCGAEFKQKHCLDNHRKNQCSLIQNTETIMLADSCPVGASSCPDRSTDQEVEVSSNYENSVQDGKGQSCQTNKNAFFGKNCTYIKINNKFQCKRCGFSAVRLVTIERHTATCNKISGKKVTKMMDTNRLEDIPQSIKKKVLGSQAQNAYCNELTTGSVPSLVNHEVLVHKKNNFNCRHCSFSCKQKRQLLQHVTIQHTKKPPFQCRFCKFSTKRNYRLEEHESIHTGIGRHTCEICHKTFGNVSKLCKHKSRMHDKTATHVCTNCDFSGFSQEDIKRHNFRCHSGALKFSCRDCDAKFSSQIAVRNHYRRAHQRTLMRKDCDYISSSISELNAHQNSKHKLQKANVVNEIYVSKDLNISAKAHDCQLCQFSAKTKKLLVQHLSKEHEDGLEGGKSLKCSQCVFTCRHQLVLEQHLRSHGGKRLYKCTQCEYSSVNKQKMTWHVRTHTGDKPYSCEECSYMCTEPSRLKQHMRVHQEERKYLCTECGYKCKWATQLKLHLTKHTGEKRFACPECEYRCSRADALRSHRNTQHSFSRPFVCENCGKCFKTAFILKTHQQQHSDVRPYSCGLCQKAFKWPAGLRHHFLSHTKQMPFCCRVCSYRAKQRFQVIKHLKKHHPEVREEEGVEKDREVRCLTIKDALEGTVEKM